MFSQDAKIALKHFMYSFLMFLIISFLNIYFGLTSPTTNVILFLPTALLTIILLKLFLQGNPFQVSIRASFLGMIFALGIYIRLVAPAHIKIFGSYIEFIAIAVVQPKQVSTDSFVINHSLQYIVAAVTSWLEFFIEAYLFPGMKQIYWLSDIGLAICIAGEILRKVSIFTAGSSFHHLVQCEKSEDHVLVTHGVYKWFRHPSYVGWFYWSIGTQNYCDYQQEVWTGIPFIEERHSNGDIQAEGEV
ncbi:hypothetical protein NQ317_015912 [Molorchus minor]|uniref:Protein-S-isoprenylcysteine O-methyltransferase n=1 Tax=Molorchus minor TaxID=1323400 RepID=A0ABQ9J2E4_9CUCU|nr:hypothetical protein NQ317_015912 [Molorchus minor]